MKKFWALILFAALLLLCSCGAVQSAPKTSEPTTEATSESLATTAQATEAEKDDRRPFSEDDIWRIIPKELYSISSDATVADFVEHVSASWYLVNWQPEIGYVHVSFYDYKPDEDWQDYEYDLPFLRIRTDSENVPGYSSDTGHGISQVVQMLPKPLLAETASVVFIDFRKVDAIQAPRYIKIGDSVQDIFDAYYGGEHGYDLKDLFHPSYIGSGRIADDCIYYTLSYLDGPEWILTYLIENGIITGIDYNVWIRYT